MCNWKETVKISNMIDIGSAQFTIGLVDSWLFKSRSTSSALLGWRYPLASAAFFVLTSCVWFLCSEPFSCSYLAGSSFLRRLRVPIFCGSFVLSLLYVHILCGSSVLSLLCVHILCVSFVLICCITVQPPCESSSAAHSSAVRRGAGFTIMNEVLFQVNP